MFAIEFAWLPPRSCIGSGMSPMMFPAAIWLSCPGNSPMMSPRTIWLNCPGKRFMMLPVAILFNCHGKRLIICPFASAFTGLGIQFSGGARCWIQPPRHRIKSWWWPRCGQCIRRTRLSGQLPSHAEHGPDSLVRCTCDQLDGIWHPVQRRCEVLDPIAKTSYQVMVVATLWTMHQLPSHAEHCPDSLVRRTCDQLDGLWQPGQRIYEAIHPMGKTSNQIMVVATVMAMHQLKSNAEHCPDRLVVRLCNQPHGRRHEVQNSSTGYHPQIVRKQCVSVAEVEIEQVDVLPHQRKLAMHVAEINEEPVVVWVPTNDARSNLNVISSSSNIVKGWLVVLKNW